MVARGRLDGNRVNEGYVELTCYLDELRKMRFVGNKSDMAGTNSMGGAGRITREAGEVEVVLNRGRMDAPF